MKVNSGLRVPATYMLSIVREFGELLRDHGLPVDLAALEADVIAGQAQIEAVFPLIDALNDSIGPQWPVKASFAWRNQMHGALDVAMRSAESLGGALDILGRYGRVRAPFARIGARKTASERIVTFSPAIPMEEAHWQAIAEFILLGSMAMIHQATDNKLHGVRIDLPNRSFAHRRLLEDSLKVPIKFDGDAFSIHFVKVVCEMALPFADKVLFDATVQQLQAEASQLGNHDWLVEDVRLVLSRHGAKRPTAQVVAQELGLSQRTLVRKLAANGTSFREILDEHLRRRTSQLMQQGDLSLEAIAEELGYGDRTSFSRARRRWSKKRH